MKKYAFSIENDPGIIGKLMQIPQVRSLLESTASGLVDKVVVISPQADLQQTQQRIDADPNMKGVKLEPFSTQPFGHMYTVTDPNTKHTKPLDRIVRVDKVTDEWGTLVTMLHEMVHHKNPTWSESQVESESERLAKTVQQFLNASSNNPVQAELMALNKVLNKFSFKKEAAQIIKLIKR